MKKRKIVLFLVVLAILIVIINETGILQRLFQREINFALLNTVAISPNSQFAVSDFGVFIADRFSVRFLDSNGDISFTDYVNLANFAIKAMGEYALVVENGGNFAWIYNQNGLVSQISTSNPISHFSLDKAGDVALITLHNGIYDIFVYNSSGFLQMQRRHYEMLSIPLGLAINSAQNTLAISYIVLDSAYINSIVSLYNIQNGQLIASNINNPNQVIGILRFYGKELLLVSQSNIFVIDSRNANIIWDFEINVQNFLMGEGWFLVYDGAVNRVYGINGQELTEIAYKNHTSSFKDTVIFRDGSNFYAINALNGAVLWQKEIYGHNANAFLVGSNDRILAISGSNARLFEGRSMR